MDGVGASSGDALLTILCEKELLDAKGQTVYL
jgi:hypothetical protein